MKKEAISANALLFRIAELHATKNLLLCRVTLIRFERHLRIYFILLVAFHIHQNVHESVRDVYLVTHSQVRQQSRFT